MITRPTNSRTAIVFAAVVLSLLAVACNRSLGIDPVLSEFAEVVRLEPSDSVDLEKDGILMPESVDVYGDWFVIKKTDGENNIVLLNPGTGESIGCFKTGRGPGEVINIGSVQILGDSLYVYDVSRAETSVLNLGASIRERRQVLLHAARWREGCLCDVCRRGCTAANFRTDEDVEKLRGIPTFRQTN